MERTKMPTLWNGSKGGFKHVISRLWVRHSTAEPSRSAVECRTRNQVSSDLNPPLLLFWRLGSFVLSKMPQFTQLYKWVPGYRQCGGNVTELVFAPNCCLARMLPREAELVSEWTGLSEEEKSVKRFERSNGLETALYKHYLYLFTLLQNRYSWVGLRHTMIVPSPMTLVPTGNTSVLTSMHATCMPDNTFIPFLSNFTL